MFQIIFNELSAAEISALPKKLQLDLLAEFQILPEDVDHLDSKRFGVIEREGKKLYRYRAKNYRIYFERREEGITVHRVLHKNTFRDFLFRTKLPVSEDAPLGESRADTGGDARNTAGAGVRVIRYGFLRSGARPKPDSSNWDGGSWGRSRAQ